MLPTKDNGICVKAGIWKKCSWKKHLWYWITNGLFMSDKFSGVFVLNGSLWNWLLIHSTTQVPQINTGRSATDHCSKSSYHDMEDKPKLTFDYHVSWTYREHLALLVKSLLPEYLFYLFLPSFSCLVIELPGSSDGKESACSAGDPSSIPGSGSSILAWSVPWAVWWAMFNGVAKSWTQLSG